MHRSYFKMHILLPWNRSPLKFLHRQDLNEIHDESWILKIHFSSRWEWRRKLHKFYSRTRGIINRDWIAQSQGKKLICQRREEGFAISRYFTANCTIFSHAARECWLIILLHRPTSCHGISYSFYDSHSRSFRFPSNYLLINVLSLYDWALWNFERNWMAAE